MARLGPHSNVFSCSSVVWLLAGLSLAAAPRPGEAQALPVAEVWTADDFEPPIRASRELVRGMMSEAAVPGASLAAGVAGLLVWAEGFGWADLEQRVPVTPLTKFRVGSVSKTMTASAIGLLVERGLMNLDAPIQTYVPGFPLKRWPITVRQVAGHTAGVRHYRGNENFSSTRYPTVESGLTIFAADTLLFEPGTAYSYSSYGWNLLSAAIEGASGTDFLTFMREEVFEPLGLRHTVADHTDSIIPHRTSFYARGDDGSVINAPYVDNSYKWAGGGFVSTPEDLVRFGSAHLRAGYLEEPTLVTLQSSQTLTSGEATNYGIGWMVAEDSDGDRTYAHSGGSVGGTTLLLLVPAHDLVVAGVVNTSGPAPAMVRRVAEVFEDHLEARRH